MANIACFQLGGATGYEESLNRQLQPRIATKAQIFEKAEGTEVTLKCDPQVIRYSRRLRARRSSSSVTLR